MKTSLYTSLQRKIIFIVLLVSLAPLILLGGTIYYRFVWMYKDKIEEQIRYRARAQAEAVDVFLKERIVLLSTVALTSSFSDLTGEKELSHVFSVMNSKGGGFVDLGVINNNGQQEAYVGPYDLLGLNYYQQPWFGEVISKGVYISDVYFGYRQIPHFIIAVLRQENQYSWIMRATIDPDIFGEIVRSAQVGKTGDAFIVNRAGVYQTQPRFDGKILSKSRLNTTLFGGESTIIEAEDSEGDEILYAGHWLKTPKWLLVISQEVAEEMRMLLVTRNIEIAIIVFGVLAIILTTVLTTRLFVTRLREADAEMNEMNAQLMQSDKLAALGKMGASVAHEINNPLVVIMQKIGWMEDLLEEEDLQKSKNLEEFKVTITKIDHHLERIRKVVHNMLGYARKMEPRLEDVDINETLNQTIDLLENYARINNIDIQTDLSSDLPIIAGNQAQLQQVFLNLISNAVDAISKDGLVEIASRRTDFYIVVTISDDGAGIPKDQQSKIFEPFFTTKEAGKGTGLGLWVSHNIIEKMGGIITLKSEKEEGSTFTVQIPVVLPEKK
ncbi:MAG: two-component sensor histidine kinase [Deltaproteobacteria bacterium]|nr:two-component sensor histidine kinase [Deltaproteobacteria bacterium]